MTQFLKKVREVDPNNAEAVKDAVNTFFQNLTKIADSDPLKWLRTLGDIINRFPKYCMSHRTTIESVLTGAIDSNDYYFVIEAAKCAQALQQVRPSQEKTATPKTSWKDQMNLLCNAAHSLISAIFPNTVDLYKGVTNVKSQEQSPHSSLSSALMNISSLTSSQNKGDKKSLLQMRLKNVFCFIQAMLVEVYPVAKPVRPQTLLDVIVRALSVSGGLKSPDIDVSAIKIEALRTLDALVACLGANLIPFSPLVLRLLMQTFRWSSENTEQDFSKIRCTAYKSLCNWLNTLHTHRSAADSRSCWEDELTNHILKDTAPPEKIVQLTMGPQPTKHMSKKAKRKLANARLLESSVASHMPGEKNKISKPEELNNELIMAALECAETFLLVCGRFLKPTTHKLLQERMIRECYNAHKYSEDLLISLLRVAEATRKTVPSGVPPPTQHCLQLYSALGHTTCGEISKFCTQALLDIRLHLHCSPPSLNFALEMPQEMQTSTNKRKKVSEKNRAVLESLLGPDRMPTLDDQGDIITIPDEPLSKKQRLDKEADKISVSSDSISSVEISDDSDIEEVPVEEEDGEVDRQKVLNSVTAEKIIEEKFNEDNGAVVVADRTNDIIETVVVKDKINVPIEETKQPESVNILKDSEIATDTNVQCDSVVENNKSDEVVMDQEKFSIHEVPTQMPLNVSTETIDGDDGPLSLEVAYDYPNTGQAEVNVLNKVDDEILPSTNETDDVMITCGQFVKSSQEVYLEKKSDDTDISEVEANEASKINGNVSENDIVENGVGIPLDTTKDEDKGENKAATKDSAVSIEDMMADFVDEVNEDVTVA